MSAGMVIDHGRRLWNEVVYGGEHVPEQGSRLR